MSRTALWITLLTGCAALVAAALLAPIGRSTRTARPQSTGDTPDETASATDSDRNDAVAAATSDRSNPPVEEPTALASDAASATTADERPLIVDPPAHTPPGFVWIPGGTFRMGSAPPDEANPHRIKHDEFPAHDVELDGFWMAETTVTNRQFDEFVRMTGHRTFAEIPPTPEELARSGAPVEAFRGKDLKAGSMCFNPGFSRRALVRQAQQIPLWEYEVWHYVEGADWRHPEGPDSDLDGRWDHPVVHVSWEDAVAYCLWAGGELPTEAQWEYAARGGLQGALYPWGNEREPDGEYRCNYWQGTFPSQRLNLDGHEGACAVKSFPPNEFGLYEMSGNVWEWCADLFHDGYYAVSPRRNPPGPAVSHDQREPRIIKRVTRGGSFLCNLNSCTGYRCAARMASEFNSGTFHTGFRWVVNPGRRAEFDAAQRRIEAWRAAQTPADAEMGS
ncbi:MAG: formylglycine-generating enzyme family protein [Planctomyces sp.]|nr:formylglycine-generating enzyme family protein [Planctomyces sp.]